MPARWRRRSRRAPAPTTRSGSRASRSISRIRRTKNFVDPLYGKTYLPRKFKIAFAIPPLNDIDIFTNCCGFIAIAGPSGKLLGYNLTAGGGMGRSHGNEATFPRLADVIGFLPPDKVVEVAQGSADHPPRFRRPQRPQTRAAEIRPGGPGRRPGSARSWSAASASSSRSRMPFKFEPPGRCLWLESAGRWPAVPRPVRRDGPHQGPGRLADEDRPAGGREPVSAGSPSHPGQQRHPGQHCSGAAGSRSPACCASTASD